MAGWTGWVAALGGLLALVGYFVDSTATWSVPLGGALGLIFGIWAALAK